MKSIIVKNIQIQFNTFDDGADKHTAINTLEEINEVLQERFNDISPQIFVSAIDDDDIEITPEDDEVEFLTITASDQHSSDSTSRTFSTSSPDSFKKDIEEWEKELPYRRYELMTNELIDDYSDEIVTIIDDLEVEY